jgi:hypothetical protein
MSDALSSPEFKYTDRHVREDLELREFAEAYVHGYGGSFEPMLNAKRELRSTGRLETRTARVVLNCARYDQNVQSQLPEPKPFTLELVKDDKKSKAPFCNDPRPHYDHYDYSRGRKESCEGVPWEITRLTFDRKIKVKAPFASARTGKVIHRTAGYGSVEWYPPRHKMGPAKFEGFVVKVLCKYPSYIANPLLFLEEPLELPGVDKKGNLVYRPRCKYCFDDQA